MACSNVHIAKARKYHLTHDPNDAIKEVRYVISYATITGVRRREMKTGKLYPILLAGLIAILIAGTHGCGPARPPTQSANKTLPYVFEGVVQTGVEGAPPVEVVLDTELPTVPDKIPVYRVKLVDEQYISDLAKRMGFDNEPGRRDDGSRGYVKGWDYVPMTAAPPDSERLEIYQDGSIRIWLGRVNLQETPKNMPSFEVAVKIARDWLISRDLYPADVNRVEKGGGLVVTSAQSGTSTVYSQVVKFKGALPMDIDMYPPSATVTIGDNGRILEAYISMTQLEEYGAVSLKTPESALEILKSRLASPLAEPPEARESIITMRNFGRLSIISVTLQYTKTGGYMQPIYIFTGIAYSTTGTRLDNFVGKVDAVAR